MSNNFVKLYGSITESTVWGECMATRIVWITMLAASDENGKISASVPGLAHLARVSIEEVESALACFMSPDPYSRTKDHEGRRIAEVDGGWLLLNHAKYRERRGPRADYMREYMARRRSVSTVNNVSSKLTPLAVDTEAEVDTEKKKTKTKARPALSAPPGLSVSIWDDWLKTRKAKGLALTATAWQAIVREAAKARLSPADAVKMAAENGWAGFKASWLERPDTKQAARPGEPEKAWHQTASGVTEKGAELGLYPNDYVLPDGTGRQDWQAFKSAVLERAGVHA
jgi:hypothetical protein